MYTLGADPLRVELKALPEGAELPSTINWSSSNTDCISLTPFTNGCMIFFNNIGTSTITISHDNPDVESLTVDLTVERETATFAVTAENRNVVGFTGEDYEKLNIPATFIGNDGIEYTVTSIENSAFSGCNKLNIITIPETVTTIGTTVFDNCDTLNLIKVDHDYEGISGAPWGATDTTYVEWLKAPVATGIRLEGLDPAKTYNEGDIIRVKAVPVPEGSRLPIIGDNDYLSLNWSYYGRPDEVLDPKYNNDIIEWSDSINEKADIERDLILLSPGIAKLEVSCRIDADWNCIEAIQDIEAAAVQHYQVTFDDDCNEVSAWPSPVVGEYDTSGSYRAGREVNITCKDSAIDQFVQWSCDDPSVEFADKTNPTTHFIMPDHDIVIDHTFVTHRVTLSGAGVGATGAGEYVPGKTVTITPGTKEGFEFVGYTCTNTTVQTELNDETPGTFVMPEADTEVIVVWNQIAPFDFIVTDQNRAMVGYTGAANEELVIPATFTGDDGVNYKVVEIGDNAFRDCYKLTSVTIPEGVTSIGAGAFWNSNLTSITIPESVTTIGEGAFANTINMQSIIIPEGVISIGDYAFASAGLYEVNIPNTVTSIGEMAFEAGNNLTTINVDNVINAIPGAPWTDTGATVNWLRTPKDFTVTPANRDMVGYNGEADQELVIPASFTGEDRQLYKVVEIGDFTFEECATLKSVTIPEGVTTIGEAAFNNCTSLESITIPNTVTSIKGSALSFCSLTTVTLPSNITRIAEGLFTDTPLTSIDIPEGVTEIGNGAFRATALTSLDIPNGVVSIGEMAFNECTELATITIPDTVTTIKTSAFSDCTSLESITIPNNMTVIKMQLFNGCTSLASVVIPEGVTIVETSAFEGCTSLTSVTLPNTVTNIGAGVFKNCNVLTTIDIPNSVTSIGNNAFYGTALTTINIDNTVDSITGKPWGGADPIVNWLRTPVDFVVTADNRSMVGYTGKPSEELTIPATFTGDNGQSYKVASIGDAAFSQCQSLVSVDIPNTVTSIGNNAFEGTNLISVTIPEGVTTIGGDVFYMCSSLTSINIPNSVTSIGDNTFDWCFDLATINIDNTLNAIPGAPWSAPDTTINWLRTVNSQLTVTDSYADASGAGVYYEGSEVTINAGTRDGYTFSGWTSNNSSVVFADSSAAETTITMPGEAVTVVANWEEIITDFTVTSTNRAMVGYTGGVGEELVIPSTFTNDGKTYNVVEIGTDAFSGCTELKSVSIPNGVKNIGMRSFRGCTSLETVNILNNTPYGVSIKSAAFYLCSSLKSINIPDKTTIWDSAFGGCTSLESIDLPQSVNLEGSSIFDGCTALKSITIPEGIKTINRSMFSNSGIVSITLPKTLTTIDNSAFYGCTDLTSVNIPDTVTSIGTKAFYNCTGLVSINIPEGITSISSSAFQGCTSLESIDLPESVKTIEEEAFSGCTSLSIVNIPYVSEIRDKAFYGCTSLESIDLSFAISYIRYYVFQGCNNLKNINIYKPEGGSPTGSPWGASSTTSVNWLNKLSITSFKFVNESDNVEISTIQTNTVEANPIVLKIITEPAIDRIPSFVELNASIDGDDVILIPIEDNKFELYTNGNRTNETWTVNMNASMKIPFGGVVSYTNEIQCKSVYKVSVKGSYYALYPSLKCVYPEFTWLAQNSSFALLPGTHPDGYNALSWKCSDMNTGEIISTFDKGNVMSTPTPKADVIYELFWDTPPTGIEITNGDVIDIIPGNSVQLLCKTIPSEKDIFATFTADKPGITFDPYGKATIASSVAGGNVYTVTASYTHEGTTFTDTIKIRTCYSYTLNILGSGTGAIGDGSHFETQEVEIYAGDVTGKNFIGWVTQNDNTGKIITYVKDRTNPRTTITVPGFSNLKTVNLYATWSS